jgi:hypothetical protein
MDELQQQAKGIAVAGHCLRADASLSNKVIGEEELKKWTDKN